MKDTKGEITKKTVNYLESQQIFGSSGGPPLLYLGLTMLANVREIRLFYVVILLKSSKWWKKHLVSIYKSYELEYLYQWMITFWALEDFRRPIWMD